MIVGIAMVRDEADIIGPILTHLLNEGVDRFIVADNLSTDDTPDILRSFPEVAYELDTEVGYYQSLKMTRLANTAAEAGATWVLPFDADELWYSPTGTIAEALASTNAHVVRASTYAHIAQASDPPFDNPVLRMVHREPSVTKHLGKVCFRAFPGAMVHQGNHDVERPGPRESDVLEIREFQYRSLEHLMRKVRNGKAAYDASDIHPMHGAHWREMGALTDAELCGRWVQMTSVPVVHDPAPWRG